MDTEMSLDGKVHIDVEGEDDYMSDDGSLHSIPMMEEDTEPTFDGVTKSKQTLIQLPVGKASSNEDLPPSLRLPDKLWTEIFSVLRPKELGQLRRVCKLFNTILNNESIWRRSRKKYFREMTRPVFGMKEWEVFQLAQGATCLVCHGAKTPPDTTPQIIWQFRTRCCNACLVENITKAVDIPPTSQFPQKLYESLPYAIVDVDGRLINSFQKPPLGAVKAYWTNDVKFIQEQYEDAKAMNADEEWLKGLDVQCETNRVDLARLEKGEPCKQAARPANQQRANGTKAQKKQQITMPILTQQLGNGFVGSQQAPHAGLIPRPPSGRAEKSQSEVAEIVAKRRSDIEAKCASLTPPIPKELLDHMPAFQAAILIALPLTEKAWDVLWPKLQEQRENAEIEEKKRLERVAATTRQKEERKAQDLVLKEVKEKTEKEWDEVQAKVKEALGKIADELVAAWSGPVTKENAPSFAADVLIRTRERYYSQFPYSPEDPDHKKPLDPSAPGGGALLELPSANRLVLENMKYVFDTRIKPLTDPHTKDLFYCNGCLEHWKMYGFEGVIQHYAAKHTTFMTLGSTIVHWKSSWPFTPPFQPNPSARPPRHQQHMNVSHYPMSHNMGHMRNNRPGYGNAMPRIPPPPPTPPQPMFGRNPQTFRPHQPQQPHQPMHQHQQGHHQQHQQHQPHQPHQHQPQHQQHQHQAPQLPPRPAHQMAPVHYQPQPPPAAPGYNQGYPYQQHPQMNPPAYGSGPPQPLAPPPAAIPPPPPTTAYPARPYNDEINFVAGIAKEAWQQLSGIKDLPVSVRVYFVIQRTSSQFKARYGRDVDFHIFQEALKEQQLMRSMRSANGLYCLSCASTGGSPVVLPGQGRVFAFHNLLAHFDSIHVQRNRLGDRFDWKIHMIKLPDLEEISALKNAPGMDEKKLHALIEAFPAAFPPGTTLGGGQYNPAPGPVSTISGNRGPPPHLPPDVPLPLQQGKGGNGSGSQPHITVSGIPPPPATEKPTKQENQNPESSLPPIPPAPHGQHSGTGREPEGKKNELEADRFLQNYIAQVGPSKNSLESSRSNSPRQLAGGNQGQHHLRIPSRGQSPMSSRTISPRSADAPRHSGGGFGYSRQEEEARSRSIYRGEPMRYRGRSRSPRNASLPPPPPHPHVGLERDRYGYEIRDHPSYPRPPSAYGVRDPYDGRDPRDYRDSHDPYQSHYYRDDRLRQRTPPPPPAAYPGYPPPPAGYPARYDQPPPPQYPPPYDSRHAADRYGAYPPPPPPQAAPHPHYGAPPPHHPHHDQPPYPYDSRGYPPPPQPAPQGYYDDMRRDPIPPPPPQSMAQPPMGPNGMRPGSGLPLPPHQRPRTPPRVKAHHPRPYDDDDQGDQGAKRMKRNAGGDYGRQQHRGY